MSSSAGQGQTQPYQDSTRSWLVAVACGWCLFWAMIINRCGGLVFVSIIAEMGATREAASWPFSLLGAVINLSGVVSGVLLKKLPLRAVSLAGSLLTGTGILLCAVFYNVIGITICLGVVCAIGQGLVFPSNAVAINTYFKKYRASGSGISYAGSTLVAFVFPSVIAYMSDEYSLRGMFLVVGALSLHAVAGSLFIRSPEAIANDKQALRNEPVGEASRKAPKRRATDARTKLIATPQDASCRKASADLGGSSLCREFSFLKRPINYVITFTGVVFTSVQILYNVSLADHAIGQGLPKWQAALLFTCSGAGDIVGRLASGQLSDRKLCHRRDVMATGHAVMAASLLALVYARSAALLGLCTALFGLASGSLIILFSVITVEYLGLETLPLAFSFQSLVCGLVALPRPLLIGYYRDKLGSYAGMYVFLASACLVTSLMWTAECFLKRRAVVEPLNTEEATGKVST
uniref:Putative monocarboxylate transporter n=1 Tax=Amblyomma sculptum TaxID=1581419 RepID=A0A1E1XTX6_AMBSC